MTSETASLVDSLASALEADGVVLQRLERYAVDGRLPRVAVLPRSVEEVAQVLAAANEHGAAVIPWGGGAHMALGNAPRRYDIALCLSRLDRVLEHEPADLTVAVQAGIALHALNEQLGRYGQFLPLDPPGGEAATVGGLLAANAWGPLRYAHGTARDWVIGMKVVHADGRISKSGGKVVKNVAGYDMSKLFIGSLGSLAVVVEVNFKVATLPRQQRTTLLAAPDVEAAARLAFALHDGGLSLRAMALLGGAAATWAEADSQRPVLAVLVAGEAAAVERSLAEIRSLCQKRRDVRFQILDQGMDGPLWATVRRSCQPSLEADRLLLKASVLPTQAAALARAWREQAAEGTPPALVGHLPLGVVYGLWQGPSLADGETAARLVEGLRAVAADLGGTTVVEGCPPALKERLDVWGEARGDFTLMRRLKDEMDPQGILAPGRFLGRL